MPDYAYRLTLESPLGEVIPDVAVTVHSDWGEWVADADGRQGVRREEIREIDIDDSRHLPAWAEQEARDIARYKWMEGR